MTRAQLLPEIFKLDAHDQLLIAEAIRNHLVGKIAPIDEAEFRSELDRRIKDTGSGSWVDWEVLKKELETL
jgi:hypothetical protein